MTLQQFLSTLATKSAAIDIVDKTNNTLIISLLASGYDALEDTLEARTVSEWSLIGSQKLKVVVE